jgi:hypothetical protein
LDKVSEALPSDLVSVEIGPGPDWAGGGAESNWLIATGPAQAGSDDVLRDVWDAQAIASAYELECAPDSVPCLDGIRVTTTNGDVDGDFSRPVTWNTVVEPSGSTGQLSSEISANASKAGLSAISVTIDSVDGHSFPIVEATAQDPVSFFQQGGSTSVFSGLQFPATLLVVRDTSGAVISLDALCRESGTGEASVASKYESDAPHFTIFHAN